jgi:sedoheptulose-bisphosphatase
LLNETGKFYVTFDPIDGSTVIDCNFSIGSIFGIWMTKDLEGKTGRQLIAAALSVYGTRTTVLYYNIQSKNVEELTLMKIGARERWIVSNVKMEIGAVFGVVIRSEIMIAPSFASIIQESRVG